MTAEDAIGSIRRVTFVVVIFTPWLAYWASGPGSDVPMQMSAVLPIYGSDPLETLARDAELDERWGDAAVLYEAAADVSGDPRLRSEALRLWAFAGQCERARDNAALTSPTSPEEAQHYDDMIEWCDLTGGMQPTR